MTKRERLRELLGPFFGVTATVLFFLGLSDFFACLACEVAVNDSPADFTRVFAEMRQANWLSAYLTLLGTFFFVWFAGFLRQELQEVEGEGNWLSSVAYGGALVTAAVALLRVALYLASAVVGEHGVNPEIARMLYVFAFEFDFLFAAPMAALVTATSTAILRFSWLPQPMGWFGVLIAIFALAWFAPGFGAAAAFLWLLLLAALLLWRAVRRSRQAIQRG